jgi:hypothetical protein
MAQYHRRLRSYTTQPKIRRSSLDGKHINASAEKIGEEVGGLEHQLFVYRVRASQVVENDLNILIDVVDRRSSLNDGLIVPDKKARFADYYSHTLRYILALSGILAIIPSICRIHMP